DSIVSMTMMSMRMVLRGLVTGVGAIFFAALINLKFATIFLFIVLFTVLFTYTYMKKSMPLYEKIRKQLDSLTSLLQENLIGARVIKALSQDNYEYKKFSKINNQLVENIVKADNIMGAKTPIITYLINMGIVLVLWWGGKDVNFGEIKVGEIIALINYLNMLVFSMGVLTFLFSISGKTMISKKRIQEVLDEPVELDEKCCRNSETNSENILEFKNVTFYYDEKSKPVLKNISFVVKKTEKIGIIGGIGAGKTTLINLIPRLYTPQNGEIYLNGTNIRGMCLGELRKRVGTVFQKSFLFSQSIKENMNWGDENADLNRIKEVVEIAQIHDFVDSLPEAYETKVYKGGVNFSGGQKQRFSIARTILKNSEILIFDDSFSALDYITESKLKKELLEKIKSTTTITVSSKVSSLIKSDKILVMDKGEIVGIGTHKELLEKNEIYKEICDSQEIYL
ncbi:MAG: ABC transporter ATP-binding protein, partial [Fusobacteriaceae bacterium]